MREQRDKRDEQLAASIETNGVRSLSIQHFSTVIEVLYELKHGSR